MRNIFPSPQFCLDSDKDKPWIKASHVFQHQHKALLAMLLNELFVVSYVCVGCLVLGQSQSGWAPHHLDGENRRAQLIYHKVCYGVHQQIAFDLDEPGHFRRQFWTNQKEDQSQFVLTQSPSIGCVRTPGWSCCWG